MWLQLVQSSQSLDEKQTLMTPDFLLHIQEKKIPCHVASRTFMQFSIVQFSEISWKLLQEKHAKIIADVHIG